MVKPYVLYPPPGANFEHSGISDTLAILIAATRERPRSRTTGGTRISPKSRYNENPRLHITDISYGGCVANQQNINLIESDGLDVNQALGHLPDLPNDHARIYDYRAGDITRDLEKHLRSLFPGMPPLEPNPNSLIDPSHRKIARGTVRSQWARNRDITPEWNPLHVPCTYFPVERQYDDLDLGPSFALLLCNPIGADKLLGESAL